MMAFIKIKHMKNAVLYLLFFCFISTKANAQLGLKGGLNLSYLSGLEEVVVIKEPGVSFQFAAIYKHQMVEERLALQMELKFIRKASTYRIGDYDVDGHLNYLELPVLGVFSIFEGALGLQAGPQFGFLTSVKYNFDNDEDPDKSFTDTDLNNYNNFDIGLGLGIALNLDHIFLELRHNIGLISVDNHIMLDGGSRIFDTRNYNTEFCVGVFF
jgi:hypothetical protein